MTNRYDAWISEYVAKNGSVRGKCASATEEMVQAFPELRRVAGFVEVVWPGSGVATEQHWWCLAPNGEVVDPTRSQFFAVLSREILDLTNPEDVARIPTGVCPECGNDVFGGENFCKPACERAYLAYLNGHL